MPQGSMLAAPNTLSRYRRGETLNPCEHSDFTADLHNGAMDEHAASTVVMRHGVYWVALSRRWNYGFQVNVVNARHKSLCRGVKRMCWNANGYRSCTPSIVE
jgi:hypothetical protein